MSESISGLVGKPYHFAYLKNNPKIDQLLKESGFSIKDADENKRNILHFAAIHNNVALILRGIDN